MGPAQLEFMKSQGLEPHHLLLDVGCGSLRGGVRFIPYLEIGNYYGIDKEPALIEAAKTVELPRYRLENRSAQLHVVEHFDISRIGVKFDFMFSHSVFSHLSPEQIEECLTNLIPWLKDDGAFFVDYKEADEVRLTQPHEWRSNEISKAWYTRDFFESMASRRGFNMTYIGDWPNHTKDKMLKFTK